MKIKIARLDRDLTLTTDSMDFAIRVTSEDGLLVARPER
jgi:hypothetical protein